MESIGNTTASNQFLFNEFNGNEEDYEVLDFE
jgi:hypothetical protein